MVSESIRSRLLAGYEVDYNGCWNWKGATASGYGVIVLNRKVAAEHGVGRNYQTHRASYEIHHGPIPEGNVVRHKCDNKLCLNPDHLEVGTQRENIQDAIDRGRMASKLTEKDIEFIRSSTLSQRRLGKLLGVSPTVIWHVRNGSKWRHV
ncbi:hypothetical protein JJDCOOPL_00008 [Salmonella phage STP-SP1]|uniref:HNH nuclease domain-containing protein n=1 Tax=Salmonella phage PRF-SP1 TaxID=2873462 RepID=A0AAE9BPM6_9CAUD|nr:hypothetical protein PKKHGKEC_00020 [Salmonella phage PRF-SP1]UFZ20902.1 hypothetical protein KCHCOFBK_00020 [Salmonella phage PRF-SP3]UIS44246.1 hypothetical protein HHGKBLGL_00020 [Salmonella phage PRF-SP5]UOL48318.1 hypothetical protein LDIKPPOO_00020 [Salmonella phage PRF-SP2]WNO24915.1 hypothetical protein GAEGOMKH_00036 [Salmonella phage PRF-SP11]WOZ56376.1 hypothetical protein KLHDILAF_00020 [Salmonella phage PRF-SP9]WOZ56435.1 hypothetical protein LINHDGPP_00030 [Salmonella phage P